MGAVLVASPSSRLADASLSSACLSAVYVLRGRAVERVTSPYRLHCWLRLTRHTWRMGDWYFSGYQRETCSACGLTRVVRLRF